MLQIPFSNRYVTLGDAFYTRTDPLPVQNPALVKFNDALARELGIPEPDLEPAELAALFAGNRLPKGAEPLAMAYAGHQFGHFVPQLGDGRAILLGEVTNLTGDSFDIQLKGSGRTVYSRDGDGRAALGPVLREYLVSEAMAKLGIPTTRALAAVTTGEAVARDRMLPGGIITRVARSFVRVGTFQYFAARDDLDATRSLADYVIDRNYPGLRDAANPYRALLEEVVDRQADLIAQWMQVGFIHGVMNTDNMSIAGETIDYGPCAFMDAYEHAKVYSYIDRHGRYAYNNQPAIGLWNLTRLAETLLPLLAEDSDAAVEIAQQVLQGFVTAYEHYWLMGMRAKFGLSDSVPADIAAEDRALIVTLLNSMAENQADFSLTFYHLSRLDAEATAQDDELKALFREPDSLADWLVQWRTRLAHENRTDSERQNTMQAVNPVYIPRNHQVEAAIRAAEDEGDLSLFHRLHEVLQNPYVQQAGRDDYLQPPRPEQEVCNTFCGT